MFAYPDLRSHREASWLVGAQPGHETFTRGNAFMYSSTAVDWKERNVVTRICVLAGPLP